MTDHPAARRHAGLPHTRGVNLPANMLNIINDGVQPFPRSEDWIADVAAFAWECLNTLSKDRSEGTRGAEFVSRLADLDQVNWLKCCYSPLTFSWLTDAEQRFKLRDEDWDSLSAELSADQHPEYLSDDHKLALWRRPVSRFLNRLQTMGQGSRSASSNDAIFLDPDSDTYRFASDRLREAVSLIQACTPGYYRDLVNYVRGVVLVDHRASFRGASGLTQCGLIFFSPDEDWPAHKWAEELVHESTHYIVHCMDLRDHLVTGENALDEVHPGPFRPDPRHHHGNFQALCVVARLIVLFTRLARSGHASDEHIARRFDYLTRCRKSYDALVESATLSPLGYELFVGLIQPMYSEYPER